MKPLNCTQTRALRPLLASFAFATCVALGLSACSEQSADSAEPIAQDINGSSQGVEETLRLVLETAQPGAVIEVPAGTHLLTRGLTLNTDGVTIRGAGMNESILNFKNQIEGAEGLLVNANDFTIEDLAIEDTQGDALKINEGRNITVRRVRTEWTGGPSVDNGAYGIYPVQTENTLIEHSVAIAASDAGIYVGQSRNIVVRHNMATHNVAGIEIENSVGADVYQNIAEDNTGGILVFNMPGIPMRGHSTRVYDNDIVGNNTANFGVPGSAVSGVPAGSGIVINSNDKVEIFGNRIADNNTANVLISSYFTANYAGQRELAKEFDPYPEGIFLYNNEFSGGGSAPDREELNALLALPLLAAAGRLPDIVWDGYVRDNKHTSTANICVQEAQAKLLNIDLGNEGAGTTMDMEPHSCEQPKLAPIAL